MQYDKADQQNCPRRVVFYGRVSTELEAQISALKNQMNWYLELAEHHPNWTVVGQYADEGISGTGMKTRPSFMKMLRDARKKKFDLKGIRHFDNGESSLLNGCTVVDLCEFDHVFDPLFKGKSVPFPRVSNPSRCGHSASL